MKKMSGKFSKKLLVFIMIFLFLFTCGCMFITYHNGTEPSTLILAVFGFCGLENGLLALIKTNKIKKETQETPTPEEETI